jgi:hypothetical protein
MQVHSWPKGRTTDYIGYVFPVGYPETALICGRCDKAGTIWLNEDEISAYQNGKRIFEGPNNFTRMRADDRGVTIGRNNQS